MLKEIEEKAEGGGRGEEGGGRGEIGGRGEENRQQGTRYTTTNNEFKIVFMDTNGMRDKKKNICQALP